MTDQELTAKITSQNESLTKMTKAINTALDAVDEAANETMQMESNEEAATFTLLVLAEVVMHLSRLRATFNKVTKMPIDERLRLAKEISAKGRKPTNNETPVVPISSKYMN